MATGLHNILEPATFKIPIVFGGNKYKKFKEATDLIDLKSVTIVTNNENFSSIFTKLKNNTKLRGQMGDTNHNYIKNNIGATDAILNYIKNIL